MLSDSGLAWAWRFTSSSDQVRGTGAQQVAGHLNEQCDMQWMHLIKILS